MTIIIGEIEYLDHRVISGWACPQDQVGPVYVTFKIDGHDIGGRVADILREDIADRGLSDGWCGWQFRLPASVTRDEVHHIDIILSAEGHEPVWLRKEIFLHSNEIQSHIDHIRPFHIYGWAKFKDDDETRVDVSLIHDGKMISTAPATLIRGEISDAGIGDGGYGFVLPIPLSRRLTPTEASVAINDKGRFRHIQDVFLDRVDVRILFVTDTAYEGNASRYYRAVLQAKLLWQSGAETTIIDRTQVKAGSFENFDVVILQRVPADDVIAQECRSAKWRQTLILYETDDLNTAPDLINETGAIRSRFRHANDIGFLQEIRGRMTSSNLADAVIVPNRFMERFYRSRGHHTIFSPFKCANSSILKKRQKTPGSSWNILYYSGSPTHKKDFETFKEGISQFLRQNKKAKLTVLGHLDKSNFQGLPRTVFKSPTSYEGLLDIIDEHDCVVAPFEKSTYNYGKSCTKFIESSVRGVPLIVSRLPDYVHHINNSGFGSLVNHPSEWYEKLMREYERRDRSFVRSGHLCDYARQTFSLQNAGSDLLDRIFEAYSRSVCRMTTS